jgi:exosortase family protein XrtG
MNVFAILAFVVWIYLLSVFYRGKMGFFYFIFGSIGSFFFLMLYLKPVLMPVLVQLVTSVTGILGKGTGLFEAYRDYSILFIESPKDGGALSLYIDFECSGIIEILVFVSLLAFFQVYGVWQRIVIGAIGCVVIFFSNVTRIFIICVMIRIWGNEVYYLAHTLIGRIVFYIFAVLLYYFVFTKAQIVRQKVGGFSYAQNNKVADK